MRRYGGWTRRMLRFSVPTGILDTAQHLWICVHYKEAVSCVQNPRPTTIIRSATGHGPRAPDGLSRTIHRLRQANNTRGGRTTRERDARRFSVPVDILDTAQHLWFCVHYKQAVSCVQNPRSTTVAESAAAAPATAGGAATTHAAAMHAAATRWPSAVWLAGWLAGRKSMALPEEWF